MAKIKEIIERLEHIAPLETQEEWDNSGWQIKLPHKTAKKILLTLDVTEDTVAQAIKSGCDLIISHHPLYFKAVKCINNPVAITAIQNGISIYSTHTCFDKSSAGTTQVLTNLLCEPCAVSKTLPINDFTRLVKLQKPLDAPSFIKIIKKSLKIKNLKIANYKKQIKSFAVCAGSGAEFIQEAENHCADCFITADIKYHQAQESRIMLIDAGHFESERPALKSLKTALKGLDAEIIISKEKPIFEIF